MVFILYPKAAIFYSLGQYKGRAVSLQHGAEGHALDEAAWHIINFYYSILVTSP
jgi:hypothetical protein